jgi:hypothetical protein
VFAQTERHLNKKSGQLQAKTSEWTHRQDQENKDLDNKLTNEKRQREVPPSSPQPAVSEAFKTLIGKYNGL